MSLLSLQMKKVLEEKDRSREELLHELNDKSKNYDFGQGNTPAGDFIFSYITKIALIEGLIILLLVVGLAFQLISLFIPSSSIHEYVFCGDIGGCGISSGGWLAIGACGLTSLCIVLKLLYNYFKLQLKDLNGNSEHISW